MVEVRLTGPRGDNPLGFLATLGAGVTLDAAGIPCQIWWDGMTPLLRWEPPSSMDLHGAAQDSSASCSGEHRPLTLDETRLISVLDVFLKRNPPSQEQKEALKRAKDALQECKKRFKDAKDNLNKQRLLGQKRKEAEENELTPLRRDLENARKHYLSCLAQVSVDSTAALDDTLAVNNQQWMDFLDRHVELWRQTECRRSFDLVSSFGVGDPNKTEEPIRATPWALIRGASRQYFLESVRALMEKCGPCHLSKALFGPWIGSDGKWSLRLDPFEDRRYALMATDPTSEGNEPKTLWGANRLAFEALQFFPVYPSHPVGVVGWRSSERGDWDDGSEVRWPLWNKPLSPAVIRSLMRLPDLWQDPTAASLGRRGDSSLSARAKLQCRGVFAVFRSKRIRDDKRYNLTPGTACWMILP